MPENQQHDWTEAVKSNKELRIITYPEPVWIVKDLIVENTFNVMAGKTGTYKTFLGLHLGTCVANGLPFLGMATSKCNVLYVDFECGEREIQKRLKMIENSLGIGTGLVEENMFILSYPDEFRLDNPNTLEKLREYANEKNIKLIIIDPLKRAHRLRENNTDEMSLLVNNLKRFCNTQMITLIAIHHTKKNVTGEPNPDMLDSVRGSSEIINAADTVLFCKKEGENLITLFNPKQRFGALAKPKYLEFSISDSGYNVSILTRQEVDLNRYGEIYNAIFVWLNTNIQPNQTFRTGEIKNMLVSRGIEYTNAGINRVLDFLKESGFIRHVERGVWQRLLNT